MHLDRTHIIDMKMISNKILSTTLAIIIYPNLLPVHFKQFLKLYFNLAQNKMDLKSVYWIMNIMNIYILIKTQLFLSRFAPQILLILVIILLKQGNNKISTLWRSVPDKKNIITLE